MDHAEEVSGISLVANDQPAKILEPGERPLHLPAALVSPERAPILRLASVCPVRRNQFDAPLLGKLLVQGVAVVTLVADQALRESEGEAGVESVVDKRDFMRRSACNPYGDRDSRAIGDGHDLGTLAPLRLADVVPPFLALAKVPSMKHSVRSMIRLSSSSMARAWATRSNVPSSTQRWNQRWQVWYGGYRSVSNVN